MVHHRDSQIVGECEDRNHWSNAGKQRHVSELHQHLDVLHMAFNRFYNWIGIEKKNELNRLAKDFLRSETILGGCCTKAMHTHTHTHTHR